MKQSEIIDALDRIEGLLREVKRPSVAVNAALNITLDTLVKLREPRGNGIKGVRDVVVLGMPPEEQPFWDEALRKVRAGEDPSDPNEHGRMHRVRVMLGELGV